MPDWIIDVSIPRAASGRETQKIVISHPDNYSLEMLEPDRPRVERDGQDFRFYYQDSGLLATQVPAVDYWDTEILWDAGFTYNISCMEGDVVIAKKDKLEVNGGGGGGPKGKKPVLLAILRVIYKGKWPFVLVRGKKVPRQRPVKKTVKKKTAKR